MKPATPNKMSVVESNDDSTSDQTNDDISTLSDDDSTSDDKLSEYADQYTMEQSLEKGDEASRVNDFPAAISFWKSCSKMGCNTAYNRLGLHELKHGCSLKAIRYLEKAIDNKYYDALVTLHSFFEVNGHPGAVEYATTLLKHYDDGITFIDHQTTSHYVANIHIKANNYKRASEILAKISPSYKGYRDTQLTFAECLKSMGLWEQLRQFASDKVVNLKVDYYYFLVEHADHIKDNVTGCLSAYMKSRCKYGLDRVAIFAAKVGRLEEYEAHLKTFSRSNGFIYRCLGNICDMKGDNEGADKYYHESMALGHTKSLKSLIDFYKKHNNVIKAVKYYSVAIDNYKMYDLETEYEEYVNTLPNLSTESSNASDDGTCSDSGEVV